MSTRISWNVVPILIALFASGDPRAAECRTGDPLPSGADSTAVEAPAADSTTGDGFSDGAPAVVPAPVPFEAGEKLVFSVEYGFISAGEATMEVAGIDTLDGRPAWHFRILARTNEIFDAFFRVEDRVESYVDVERLSSRRFSKSLREGGYSKDYEVYFDDDPPRGRTAEGDTVEILPDTQDVLSAFYYLRTRPLRVGAKISVPCHDNGKNYPLVVKVHRKEKVAVPAGRFVCYVVEPMLKSGGLTGREARMLVWITADERRLPVRMETKIKVGAIAAKLKSIEAAPPAGRDP